MVARKGFESVIVNLDDILDIGDNFDECLLSFNTLINLLRDLGFNKLGEGGRPHPTLSLF